MPTGTDGAVRIDIRESSTFSRYIDPGTYLHLEDNFWAGTKIYSAVSTCRDDFLFLLWTTRREHGGSPLVGLVGGPELLRANMKISTYLATVSRKKRIPTIPYEVIQIQAVVRDGIRPPQYMLVLRIPPCMTVTPIHLWAFTHYLRVRAMGYSKLAPNSDRRTLNAKSIEAEVWRPARYVGDSMSNFGDLSRGSYLSINSPLGILYTIELVREFLIYVPKSPRNPDDLDCLGRQLNQVHALRRIYGDFSVPLIIGENCRTIPEYLSRLDTALRHRASQHGLLVKDTDSGIALTASTGDLV